jgi:type VI secretion system secreted protein VgrG
LGTSQPEYNSQLFYYEQSKEFKQDSKSVSQSKSLSALTNKSPKASKKIFKDSSYLPVYHQVDDAKSLDEVLKYKRDGAQSKMTRCKGQSLRPDVKVGNCVQVKGMNQKFDGYYYVTAVTHAVDQGGKYNNTFQCIPFDIAHPEYNGDRNRGALIQTGVVVDNADPEKMGRIKVKFPWVQGETFWTRYLTAHAGEKHGWYSIPEIDDEVLCAFEMGDPDRPIVLGSMYNSKATPPDDSQVAENNVKMFLTKGGNKILIRDEGGKEAIEIVNNEGKNTIVLEAGGPTISIKSEGDIAITGANIKIKGSGNIEIEADSDIKEKAGANMEIKAGANMKVEASGTQDVKGAMVNVKGNPINLN